MATMFNAGLDCGAGFSKLVSIGNQADVTENEVFETLLGDADTRAFAFYAEGFSNAGRFLENGARARAAGKPVVVVKAGRAEAGRAAAFSHTASLAGPYRLFEAAARSRGILISDDTESAVMIADAVLRWPSGISPSQGIALVSGSGGGAGILADRISDAGLPALEPGASTRSALGSLVPLGRAILPLDAGALNGGEGLTRLEVALRALAGDPATGALLYLMTTQPAMPEIAALLATIARDHDKPVVLILSAGSVANPLRAKLREERIFHCNRIDDAIRVPHGLVDFAHPLQASSPAVTDPAIGNLADHLAADAQ
jgi:acetyl-CoA synthetase (ADP-forming)